MNLILSANDSLPQGDVIRRCRQAILVMLIALLVRSDVWAAAAPQPEPLPVKQPDDVRGNAAERRPPRRAGRPARKPPDQQQPQPFLPDWVMPILWTLGSAAAFYACVILVMSLVGVAVAFRTRGQRALLFLGEDAIELTSGGQVVRLRPEAGFTKVYAGALVLGLVLFYISIPFVLIALLGVASLLVYFLLKGKKFTGKGIVFVVCGAGAMAWAIIRSLLPRGLGERGEPPGIAQTPADAPRLHEILRELAYRMDTEPVQEVCVTAGALVTVQQEGRGLFGLFGTSKRTLQLGYSSLPWITVGELKALLAHEHAHFSHRDTFFSRLIYRVTDSIESALRGMRQAGGKLNYVNPFYWFLFLYYKAYLLLAVGFTRSREYLADRMASTLYGANLLASGLTKVETDGAVWHKAIEKAAKRGIASGNVYAEVRQSRAAGRWEDESDRAFIRLLKRRASFFASQPGYRERIEALAGLPRSHDADPTPACRLLGNHPDIETALTDMMTQAEKSEATEQEAAEKQAKAEPAMKTSKGVAGA